METISMANQHTLLLLGLVCLAGCRQEESTPTVHETVAPPASSRHAADDPASRTRKVAADETTTSPEKVQPSFRPPDERPRQDPARLSELGIHEYRSRRLMLYSDIEPEIAETLPPLLDQAFEAWENYFGPLPPARDGSDYQITGYLMRDQNRFRQAGLLPVTLARFAHGKHDAQQFWMNDSEYDYYRRHLMIHEATHCFMQAMGGTTRDVPVWYLEGMAELFGTHRQDDEGLATFGVMPVRREDFVGFGRIPIIGREIDEGRLLTVDEIGQLQPTDFVRNNESYAWAWAICTFLDLHPRYHDALQSLSREYVDEGFQTANHHILGPLIADLATEWQLFARHLCYGFDVERAAIEFITGQPITDNDPSHQTQVSADRGWQSSEIAVSRDQRYTVQAKGWTVLAEDPKPWRSQPPGISIRYSEGRPIGRLLGVIIGEPDPATNRRMSSDVIDLGPNGEIIPPIDGTLYLRVNDFWNELADNSGEYAVTVGVSAADN